MLIKRKIGQKLLIKDKDGKNAGKRKLGKNLLRKEKRTSNADLFKI